MNQIVSTVFKDSIGSPLLWALFFVLVLTCLMIDLGVFNRRSHDVGFKEALCSSAAWIALALLFNGFILWRFGADLALEFLTGYVIEKSLSVDNIFVFLVIFSYFSVPSAYQHRVLFLGIFGALVMRGFFILLGAGLFHYFDWVIYLFGIVLIVTAFKLLRQEEENFAPDKNPVFLIFKRAIPSVGEFRGAKFFVKEGGRWFATPLFLVVIAIEIADIVFAVDSIPAIFAITQDPFIVFTSNIFAILGLRALYFLLASLIDSMKYLRVGLALVLAFIGLKMLTADIFHVPTMASLIIIGSILGSAVVASLIATRKNQSNL